MGGLAHELAQHGRGDCDVRKVRKFEGVQLHTRVCKVVVDVLKKTPNREKTDIDTLSGYLEVPHYSQKVEG